MGNSGGAFDNAKKYIESGQLQGHGKGSAAHKASVTGDTIGDTRKDVVGVALDIFIKMMSTVANTLAPILKSVSLFKF
jgi:K(+)-stimulated pyrophosphate-energized sodium pump